MKKNTGKIITIFVIVFIFFTILFGIFSTVKNWSNGIVDSKATQQAIEELEKQYAEKQIELQKEFEKKLEETYSIAGEEIASETIKDIFYVTYLGDPIKSEHIGLYINNKNGGYIAGKTLNELDYEGKITATEVYKINTTYNSSINIYTPSTLNTLIIYTGNVPTYLLKAKEGALINAMFEGLNKNIEQAGVSKDAGLYTKEFNHYSIYGVNYTTNEVNLSDYFDCYKLNPSTGAQSFIKECKTSIYTGHLIPRE